MTLKRNGTQEKEPILRVMGMQWYVEMATLHLEMWSIMCNGADENQAHRCDPYGLRVQEQPLFLVCSSITIFTPMDQVPLK